MQLLQKLEYKFYFEGTWWRWSKPEYPEKNPDSLPLIGITYECYLLLLLFILEKKSNVPDLTGLEPSPASNIGDKLAWPRARAASDPLSHRRPLVNSQ